MASPTEMMMLQRGDSVPFFEVTTVDGKPFSYSSIWQRKNLLLLTLPPLDVAAYINDVTTLRRRFGDGDVECVITEDRVPQVNAPGVVIADRWGEVVFAVEKSDVADLPRPEELVEWLTYVQHQCPECEGEAR
jgi:hypothetical protein